MNENLFDIWIQIFNFIWVSSVNTRIFKAICEKMSSGLKIFYYTLVFVGYHEECFDAFIWIQNTNIKQTYLSSQYIFNYKLAKFKR